MSTIAWIVEVNTTSGNIEQIYSVPGTNIPENGHEDLDNEKRIIHLFSYELADLNFDGPAQFMEEYRHDGNTWRYKGAKPGEFYMWNDTSWVINTTALSNMVRNIRNGKLYESDWTQANDSPLSDEKKAEWRTYRQSLRDIMINLPADLDDPENVSWPTEPS